MRIDRVIDGVGDRTGDVLGDRRLYGEIAVRETRELIEQPQDRLLVAIALLARRIGGDALLLHRAPHLERRDECGDEEAEPGCDQQQRQVAEQARGGSLSGRRSRSQITGIRRDGVRRRLCGGQRRRCGDGALHGGRELGVDGIERLQVPGGIRRSEVRERQAGRAAGEAGDHLAEIIAAFGNALCCLSRITRALRERRDIQLQPLGTYLEALDSGAGHGRICRRHARG
jgi:hypothetical protein